MQFSNLQISLYFLVNIIDRVEYVLTLNILAESLYYKLIDKVSIRGTARGGMGGGGAAAPNWPCMKQTRVNSPAENAENCPM